MSLIYRYKRLIVPGVYPLFTRTGICTIGVKCPAKIYHRIERGACGCTFYCDEKANRRNGKDRAAARAAGSF